MAKKRKQIYTVHYSISGIYDVDVEAASAKEALNLAEDTITDEWYKDAQFDMDCFQVTNENGDVVWGMS